MQEHRQSLRPFLICGHVCLSIAEVPDAPKQPTVLEGYQDSALISWEPPADGGKPITGYIVERKETMANRYISTAEEKMTFGSFLWGYGGLNLNILQHLTYSGKISTIGC